MYQNYLELTYAAVLLRLTKSYFFIPENKSYSWRQRLVGLHDTVRNRRDVGPLHVPRGPRLLPAPGDAHEGREPADGRQRSPGLQILLLSGEAFQRDRLLAVANSFLSLSLS